MNTKERAFTLVEMLTATVIILFILTVIFSAYTTLSKYVRDTTAQAFLQTSARIAVEKMTRSIRLASGLDCSAEGDRLTLTYNPARLGKTGQNWVSEYVLSGSRVIYYPNKTSSEQKVIIDDVSLDAGDKLFDYLGNNMVAINLQVKKNVVGATKHASIATTVRSRNAE